MHPFDAEFYGHEMRAVVLGYIRPELDYTSRGTYQRWFPNHDTFLTRPPSPSLLPFRFIIPPAAHPIVPCVSIFSEGLIEDIETDKRVALKSLMRPAYQKFSHDEHFDIIPTRKAHS